MRVVCIDVDAWPYGVSGDDGGVISNGKVYDVVDVFFDEGHIFYTLSESKNEEGYWENCFARLSDIDETEMERNYQLEKSI